VGPARGSCHGGTRPPHHRWLGSVAVGDVGSRGQAAGMSRAITGGRRGEPTSTSLLKQVFCLVDGRYLDDETQALRVYDVRMVDGFVVELATI